MVVGTLSGGGRGVRTQSPSTCVTLRATSLTKPQQINQTRLLSCDKFVVSVAASYKTPDFGRRGRRHLTSQRNMRLTWSNANTTNSTSLAWFLTTLYTHVRCLAFVLCFAFYPRLIWVVSNHFCIVVFHSGFPKKASGWLILHSSCMGQAYIGIYSASCSRGRIEFSWFWTCYCFNVKSCPHSYSAHPVKPLSQIRFSFAQSVIYVCVAQCALFNEEI